MLGGELRLGLADGALDVILVDLFRPHMMPMNMPVYRVTCFANAADVCMTMVGGRVGVGRGVGLAGAAT